MIKKTIYIGNPAYLKLKQNQMLIEDAETKTTKGSIPIEDMALLVLDHFQITISNQLLIPDQIYHMGPPSHTFYILITFVRFALMTFHL